MDYNQYKGKPFQVISRLQVRYTGIFQDIDQESQTLCLSDVFNHGWVRFHTNSIEAIALLDSTYRPPVSEEPVDPILASVSQSAPQQREQHAAPSGNNGLASLPPKPAGPTASANAALDRVQKSLNDLSVDGRRRNKPQPPAVPDAEFDFSKGNERFQKERQAFKESTENPESEEAVEVGEPEQAPHPSAIAAAKPPAAAAKSPTYSKSSFFDNISSDSSRVSRASERHRNFDTFGEAGGSAVRGAYGGGRGGGPGQRGGRGARRGGGAGGSWGANQTGGSGRPANDQ